MACLASLEAGLAFPVTPGCAHCVSRITWTSGMPCLSVGLRSPCEMSLVAYSSTP